MAIDSVVKRMSAMTVGGISGYVYPTGTVGAAARQDVVGIYRGIVVALPVIGFGTTNMIAMMRPLHMMILFGGH